MRRIKAAGVKWQMGATKADYLQAGWSEKDYEGIAEGDKPREVPHSVMLTYDYFIGIYPVTQEQYRRFTKASALGGYFTGYADSALRPRCGLNYNWIRGSGTTTEHSSVKADSAIGKLRAYTGIDFDLPSDAEWEYACKAGTTWLLYTGAAYTESNVKKLAWISSNSSSATQPVGRKLPNAWGLYDMIGNTLEWCRDYWVKDLGTNDVVNPVNTVYNGNRTMRGSRYNYVWKPYAHTTYRTADIPNRSADQAKAYGFRVMCPIQLKFTVEANETGDK
jgi:formylglycine-generating enzyme required for sulfatase activity